MDRELIINSSEDEVVITLLENKELVELNREKTNSSFSVGDVYLGKVKKIAGGLNAAFVDVGYEKDAFLHYFDLGPQMRSLNKFIKQTQGGKRNTSSLADFSNEQDIDKGGKITEVLSPNQNILVQIAKEPISTKGPRITCEVTFAGRYLVLVPFSERISISQRIKNPEERERLKRLIKSIKPKNFGVIIRTVAENKKVAQLDADLSDLFSKWDQCFKGLQRARPPKKILGELSRTSAILRDILNASFQNIHVNDPSLYEEIKNYLRTISPEHEKIVKLYKGKAPIFEHFGIEKQIKALFGKHVTLKSGAYLVIEHTEALHVIDVNSGTIKKGENDQESNALRVNLEVAAEVARQLRLRDMGGIIVVDFIDLQKSANRKLLYERMVELMKNDKAKHNILPPTKFGLVQITRQRVRPEMDIKTAEKCPCCNGTGEVQASILLVDEIENNLRYILREQNEPAVTLCVHPFVAAYLKSGIPSIKMKWLYKYGRKVKIRPVMAYQFLEYRFLNASEEEIVV